MTASALICGHFCRVGASPALAGRSSGPRASRSAAFRNAAAAGSPRFSAPSPPNPPLNFRAKTTDSQPFKISGAACTVGTCPRAATSRKQGPPLLSPAPAFAGPRKPASATFRPCLVVCGRIRARPDAVLPGLGPAQPGCSPRAGLGIPPPGSDRTTLPAVSATCPFGRRKWKSTKLQCGSTALR